MNLCCMFVGVNIKDKIHSSKDKIFAKIFGKESLTRHFDLFSDVDVANLVSLDTATVLPKYLALLSDI